MVVVYLRLLLDGVVLLHSPNCAEKIPTTNQSKIITITYYHVMQTLLKVTLYQ